MFFQMRGSTRQVLDDVDRAACQIGQEFMRGNRNEPFFHSGNNLGMHLTVAITLWLS